jgi:diguanylate cyclase (GGDEF)-like protein/PAS domain S-box-containing protein
VVNDVRKSRKELVFNLTHPPYADRRFWWAQVMVVAVALVHFVGDLAQARGLISVPGFVWILLLFIPVIYAGTTFGLVGSLGTALLGIVTLAPTTLFLSYTRTGPWGEWSILTVVAVSAVVLGDRFEAQRAITKVERMAQISDAVRDSEQRFRLAFEDNMAPMLFTNPENEVTAVNDAFCQMLGRNREEILGHNLTPITHPEDGGIGEKAHRRLTADEVEQVRYVKRYLQKDGRVTVAEVLKSSARDAGGRLLYLITILRDITEERALAAQLSHQALHDSLTGLPNRALLQDRLSMAHDREVRHGGRSALFLLDLDDFKSVNDTSGHLVGDQLLIALARRLEKVTRAQDTLCRFGGDEFIYLAEGVANETDVEQIIERLLGVFAEPFLVAGIKIDQSTSIGVAVPDDASDQSYATLVQNADTAVYEAKRRGPGQHVLFTAAMRELVSARFTLRQALGHALTRGELSMHYQPIVDLGTGGVVGYEALMRWQHPEQGSIPPDVFIPLAEESDLIVALGSFALGDAIAEAASWESATPDPAPAYVAVNLCAHQFHDPSLLSIVEAALASSGLAPERLVLEITERVALFNIDSAISAIERLKQLNVRVALDDFGTGYSSLSYLVRLSPDIIMIDRSFVNPATMDTSAERLLEAIVRLCHGLGVAALAEGIETREQLTLLSDLGCEFGQGSLFSPAVSASELPALPALVLRNWAGGAGPEVAT